MDPLTFILVTIAIILLVWRIRGSSTSRASANAGTSGMSYGPSSPSAVPVAGPASPNAQNALRCNGCGAPNPVVARFCSACGTPIERNSGTVMVPAAAPAPPITFDASLPPQPGDPVPPDCVWARYPYPGPLAGPLRGQPHKRISDLGLVVGRPMTEIVACVGQPSSRQLMVSGEQVVSWAGKDFWTSATVTVSLLFDRYGVCEGVAGESASGPNVGVGVGVAFPV